MSQFNLWLALLGGLTLLLGLGAGVMSSRTTLLSQPIVAVVVGVAVGPQGLDLLRVTSLNCTEASIFVGWFGPIGIAAVFYALLAVERTGMELVWVVGSLVVAGSILAHGATAVPATHWYGQLDDADESW